MKLNSIRKILIIKPRAIGDVVLSTVVIPNIRNAFQSSMIHFAVEPAARDVITGNKDVDQVIVMLSRQMGKPSRIKRMIESMLFLRDLQKEKYDLVFDLFGNPRSAILTWLSRAKYRVGYDFRGRKYAYNIRVRPRGDRVHEVDFNLDAVRELNIPVVDRCPYFPIPGKAIERMDRWLHGHRLENTFLVGIHPYGSWEAKRWGPDRFAALADRLFDTYRASVLIFWGPGEKEYAQKVCSLARTSPILTPQMSLKELGALLFRCDLVVANDSGPMHISAAVGTRTLGIFGPTSWKLQGPFGSQNHVVYKKGLACLGCNRLTCDERVCMKTLSVDDVMWVIEEMNPCQTYSGSKQHEIRQA
jgi:ADP-heptose:LPS heptosyltransferase